MFCLGTPSLIQLPNSLLNTTSSAKLKRPWIVSCFSWTCLEPLDGTAGSEQGWTGERERGETDWRPAEEGLTCPGRGIRWIRTTGERPLLEGDGVDMKEDDESGVAWVFRCAGLGLEHTLLSDKVQVRLTSDGCQAWLKAARSTWREESSTSVEEHGVCRREGREACSRFWEYALRKNALRMKREREGGE